MSHQLLLHRQESYIDIAVGKKWLQLADFSKSYDEARIDPLDNEFKEYIMNEKGDIEKLRGEIKNNYVYNMIERENSR